VQHIGIDLAWGPRQPTGLAVLDDAGRLVHVSAVRTDEEIETALAPFTAGPCIVAIDAPLVVTNATGNRAAERALNADFARFQAGAHPTNTGKPEFTDGDTRGGRIGRRLGLDLDPRSGRDRRAIEVYPHAATVALFRLGRTLKYKNKPGRVLEQMRAELLLLIDLLGAVVELELGAPFAALRQQVQAATRKSELRVAEDQVDAVLCAYVALFAHRRPEDTTTYGDGATGYIVTPTLPEGHVPTPRERAPRPDKDPVKRAVQAYAARQPVVQEITDQIGVRVITYLQSDVMAVADLLSDQLAVLDDRDMGQETASEGRFGYASRHLLVAPEAGRSAPAAYEALHERRAQVQVRTVLQHAWAEFEHAIRYKGTIPEEHVPDLDRRFTLAAGLLELADREFTLIRDRLQATVPEQHPEVDHTAPRISAQDLATFLASQYADAGWSRTDHYAWVSGLLLELGITSLDELAGLLTSVDSSVINARMGYRYPPGAVRRLDDALLAVFGERYVALHGNDHRVGLLRTRLDRLRHTPGSP
jgi:predicted RNase H-like nuclease/ppGpp synthetase/RelA/SpoT-type nucleotidyltranferase